LRRGYRKGSGVRQETGRDRVGEKGIEDVLSGRRQGLSAGVLRAGLSLATPFYAAAVAARNLAYDRG
jgi:hypothetical protein